MHPSNQRSMTFDGMPPTAVMTGCAVKAKASAVADVVQQHRVFTLKIDLETSAQPSGFGQAIGRVQHST